MFEVKYWLEGCTLKMIPLSTHLHSNPLSNVAFSALPLPQHQGHSVGVITIKLVYD